MLGVGANAMNCGVDQHALTDTAIYRGLSSAIAMRECAIQRGRAFSRTSDNAGMGEATKTNIKLALERVLEAQRSLLETKNNWATLAGLTESTARTAFSGRNTTVKTLQALADAAGMTISQMLEYGEPDWKVRVRARAVFSGWTAEELEGFLKGLERQSATRANGAA